MPEEKQNEQNVHEQNENQAESQSEKTGILGWIVIILLSPLLLYGFLEEILGGIIEEFFKLLWRGLKFLFFLPWNLIKYLWG